MRISDWSSDVCSSDLDPHALVQVLYEELVRALRVTAWAAEHRQLRVRSEKATRSIAILFALESGLDFERGGEVSRSEERRVGHECVSPCRSRWSPDH